MNKRRRISSFFLLWLTVLLTGYFYAAAANKDGPLWIGVVAGFCLSGLVIAIDYYYTHPKL